MAVPYRPTTWRASTCGTRRTALSTSPKHADRKCRCTPLWKGRFKSKWGPTCRDRSEAQGWLKGVKKGTPVVEERTAAGRAFGSLGREWLEDVEAGTIQRRRRGTRCSSARASTTR
jgi:hypothetical protein